MKMGKEGDDEEDGQEKKNRSRNPRTTRHSGPRLSPSLVFLVACSTDS